MYNPYGPKRAAKAVVSEVVSFEQEDHPGLARNLLRDLQDERAKWYDGLIASKDWADFERRRGLINGLDNAISLCEAAKKQLES
jgi:hypothetical protein